MNYETTVEAQDDAQYAASELDGRPVETRVRSRRKWAIIALIAAVVLIGAWYLFSSKEETDPLAAGTASQPQARPLA